MLTHHPQHRLAIKREAFERANLGCNGTALEIRFPGKNRRDGAGNRARLVAVVRKPFCHEQGAEVRIPESERPKNVGIFRDLCCGVCRATDNDLLRGDEDINRVPKHRYVKRAVVLQQLQEVNRGEITRGVIKKHVLAAGIARMDPVGIHARVPVVRRRVKLQPGIAAGMRCLGDETQHPASAHRLEDLAGLYRLQLP